MKKKVTLEKPHTHEGIKYEKGDTIEVSEDTAELLKKWGVIKTSKKITKYMED
jgi:hypothetical protein